MEQKIINIKQRIDKHKNQLPEDYILIETTLSILDYILSEGFSKREMKILYDSIKNTLEIIEEKINTIVASSIHSKEIFESDET